MVKNKVFKFIIFSGLFLISCTASQDPTQTKEINVSGYLEDGYRIIDLKSGDETSDLTVYRGDYIKLRSPESVALTVPGLNIEHTFDDDSFVKMKTAGVFEYTFGSVRGKLNVIEYTQQKYHELSASQTKAMIDNGNIVLLDVRTPGEYNSAHIEDAALIPVQALQQRMGELEKYKNTPIVVYCASGNRSTVASKMLIDAGFNNVNNVRYGIRDWINNKYPVISGR